MHERKKWLIVLHFFLILLSGTGVMSKMAARSEVLSTKFCIFYAVMVVILGIYAIGWQQIIKHLPLSVAFTNRSATIVWGLIWGAVFFDEQITAGKLLGVAIVICGVILYNYERIGHTDAK